MRAKWMIFGGILLIIAGLALWISLRFHDWENWLGFSRYDYFVAGTNYAFTSGPGPMLLTALGFSGVIGGLWHAHNCHQDGCWNVGKHRVKGSPYCNSHYEAALTHRDTDDLLTEIMELNTQILAELKALRSGAS